MPDNQRKVRSPNLLNSWKEIAAFLDRGVRTVQRWEREHQLPVHRIGNSPRAAVFALQEELLLWLRLREQTVTSATHMEADKLIAQAQLLELRAKELRQQASELRSKKNKAASVGQKSA
jgi:phage terminase Nu1 subunit (DNA packaging protein)